MTIRNMNFPIEEKRYLRIKQYAKEKRTFLKDAILELIDKGLETK